MAMVLLTSVPLFAEPHAYPVPFTPGKNAAHTAISFTNLPASGTIKIYTIDGRQVVDLAIPNNGILDWPATNSKGEKVATGVYIYRIEGDGQETEGKLVVIR